MTFRGEKARQEDGDMEVMAGITTTMATQMATVALVRERCPRQGRFPPISGKILKKIKVHPSFCQGQSCLPPWCADQLWRCDPHGENCITYLLCGTQSSIWCCYKTGEWRNLNSCCMRGSSIVGFPIHRNCRWPSLDSSWTMISHSPLKRKFTIAANILRYRMDQQAPCDVPGGRMFPDCSAPEWCILLNHLHPADLPWI